MAKKDLRVLVKEVGQDPVVEVITTGLESMQALVGGMIEHVFVPFLAKHRIDMWANEEGLLHGLPLNVTIYNQQNSSQPIVGDVFFSGAHHSGSSVSLSPKQVKIAEDWLLAGCPFEAPT